MDLFGGSGSTLIACEQTDRICRTMELDPKYATVIVERFHLEYPDQEITVLRTARHCPTTVLLRASNSAAETHFSETVSRPTSPETHFSRETE
jgi:hypothetical protein